MDDFGGPDPTDPIWMDLSTSPDMTSDRQREPIHMPDVDPSEVWEDVPLYRELKGYEGADLVNTLRLAAIPTRHRDTKRGGGIRALFTGRVNMVPQVPRRFLSEAARVASEFLNEEDLG